MQGVNFKPIKNNFRLIIYSVYFVHLLKLKTNINFFICNFRLQLILICMYAIY
jgi:hypothetical protein